MRVVQFKIRFCFRIEVCPRNPHTIIVSANNEAGISGHCLDSSGKSMECVSKRRECFLSKKENGTYKIFFFGDGLRIFSPRRAKRRGNFDLEYFCPKRKGKEIGLRVILSK